MTGIIYGSTTGNTETAAKTIADKLGSCEVINVSDFSADILDKYDTLLLGSSTWGVGDLQDDWETKIAEMKGVDLNGKKVGFFGCGDQDMYPDSFGDALKTLYDAVSDSGAEFVGAMPTDGYDFSESAAVIDGNFIGLILDEDNQADKSDVRIDTWVKKIK